MMQLSGASGGCQTGLSSYPTRPTRRFGCRSSDFTEPEKGRVSIVGRVIRHCIPCDWSTEELRPVPKRKGKLDTKRPCHRNPPQDAKAAAPLVLSAEASSDTHAALPARAFRHFTRGALRGGFRARMDLSREVAFGNTASTCTFAERRFGGLFRAETGISREARSRPQHPWAQGEYPLCPGAPLS